MVKCGFRLTGEGVKHVLKRGAETWYSAPKGEGGRAAGAEKKEARITLCSCQLKQVISQPETKK